MECPEILYKFKIISWNKKLELEPIPQNQMQVRPYVKLSQLLNLPQKIMLQYLHMVTIQCAHVLVQRFIVLSSEVNKSWPHLKTKASPDCLLLVSVTPRNI